MHICRKTMKCRPKSQKTYSKLLEKSDTDKRKGLNIRQSNCSNSLAWTRAVSRDRHSLARRGLQLHMYADDCQVYLSTSVEHIPQAVDGFTTCVAGVNAWLTTNRLRLNASKTVLIWLGSSHLLDKVMCKKVLLLGTRVAISDSARDLGIIIDRESCPSRRMSPRSVEPATTNSANSDQ